MATKAPKFKYTPEIETSMIAVYGEKGNAVVAELAAQYGVTNRSVISKLAQLGVYQKDVPAAKQPRDEGPTKKELMAQLKSAGFDPAGLDGATKEALARILQKFQPAEVAE